MPELGSEHHKKKVLRNHLSQKFKRSEPESDINQVPSYITWPKQRQNNLHKGQTNPDKHTDAYKHGGFKLMISALISC